MKEPQEFAVENVGDLDVRNVAGVADGRHANVGTGTLPYGPR